MISGLVVECPHREDLREGIAENVGLSKPTLCFLRLTRLVVIPFESTLIRFVSRHMNPQGKPAGLRPIFRTMRNGADVAFSIERDGSHLMAELESPTQRLRPSFPRMSLERR